MDKNIITNGYIDTSKAICYRCEHSAENNLDPDLLCGCRAFPNGIPSSKRNTITITILTFDDQKSHRSNALGTSHTYSVCCNSYIPGMPLQGIPRHHHL